MDDIVISEMLEPLDYYRDIRLSEDANRNFAVADLLVTGSPRAPFASPQLETLSPKKNLCPSCRGRKYVFTSYFHNNKVFPEPPHNILFQVEDSYMVRDRLKSLLVTYTMREVEQDRLQSILAEIRDWGNSVEDVALGVQSGSELGGFLLNEKYLDDARKWKDGIVDQLSRHVSGREKLVMPSGRLLELMHEYRKLWERVWLGYIKDRNGCKSYLGLEDSSVVQA